MDRLPDRARRALLRIARQAIAAGRPGAGHPPPPPDDPALLAPGGAFVTLRQAGRLRGCIGSFHGDRPLYRTVHDMARAAAFEDPRFPPLDPAELPSVRLEISVLSPLEPVTDPGAVEVGRHGLQISRGAHRGVLLPQVATEYGWDRETFLSETCRKAGLPPEAWREGATIEVFEADVFGEDD